MTNAISPPLRTPDEVRADFDRQGKTLAQFARENGLDQATVYQVLSGRKKGRRGEAHRAAVLLGLKAGEVTNGGRNDASRKG